MSRNVRRSFTVLMTRVREMRMSAKLDNRTQIVRALSYASLIIVAFAAIAAATQLRKLETRYSLTEFMAQNDQAVQSDRELRKRYKLSDLPLMIVVAERGDGWLSKPALEELSTTAELLREQKSIKTVTSLGTLETVVRDQGQIRFGKINEVLSETEWTKLVTGSELAAPGLISRDGRWAAFLLELASGDDIPSQVALVQSLTAQRMKSERVLVGGVPVVQNDLTRLLSNEMLVLSLCGILASTLALIALFRGHTAVLISGLSCVISNIIVLGSLAAMGRSLGVLSLSLPVIVAVQALSISIHSLFSYVEMRKTMGRIETLTASFKRLLFPNLLVSLATALGFATLASSPVVAMRDFGFAVALASVALWAVTTLITYPLLALLPEPALRSWISERARWMLIVLQKRKLAMGIIGGTSALALFTGLDVNYSHRLFNNLAPSYSSSLAASVVDQSLGGMIPLEVELQLPGGTDTWLGEAQRARLSKLVGELRTLPAVGSVVSPIDLFSFAGASTTKSIEETETLFAMAPRNPMKSFLRDEGRSVRLSLRMHDLPGDQIESGIQDIRRSIASLSPESNASIGGWGSYIHRMNRDLAKSLVFGFWDALAVIFVLLIITFRSFRWAIVAVVPTLVPPLFLVGAVSYFRIEVTPGLAIVFAIALGFAFNNTIYLMKRVKQLAGETADGRVTARVVKRAFYREAQSCLLASLTLLIGFTSLCFSEFAMTRNFGLAMVFSMLAGILGDLILLPALLRTFPDLLNAGGVFRFSRKRVAVATASLSALIALPSHAATVDLKAFARDAAKMVFARDEKVEIEMINVEADGEEEKRRIEMRRATTKKGAKAEQRIVARILEPKNLRGTSVLTVTDGENQNRWIYIPSSKQVRRVVGGDEAGAPILGSELSTEDLDLGQVDGAKATIVEQKDGRLKVEAKIPTKESAYSKCVAIFDEKTKLFQQADCNDKSGTPLKRITVKGYRKLKGGVSRPTEMRIENLKTKRVTRLVFSEQKVNAGLKASEFTPEALKD